MKKNLAVSPLFNDILNRNLDIRMNKEYHIIKGGMGRSLKYFLADGK